MPVILDDSCPSSSTACAELVTAPEIASISITVCDITSPPRTDNFPESADTASASRVPRLISAMLVVVSSMVAAMLAVASFCSPVAVARCCENASSACADCLTRSAVSLMPWISSRICEIILLTLTATAASSSLDSRFALPLRSPSPMRSTVADNERTPPITAR